MKRLTAKALTTALGGKLAKSGSQNVKRALLLGEPNFSYTLEALKEKHNNLVNYVVYTTSLESEEVVKKTYMDAAYNLKQLKLHKNVHVYHGIDATNLSNHPIISHYRYDLIQFNFPHYPVGPEDKEFHRRLLFSFFLQSANILQNNGVVKVLLQTNEPYSSWKLENIAKGAHFKLLKHDKFRREEYEAYKPKKGWGKTPDGDLNFSEARFYEFCYKEVYAGNNNRSRGGQGFGQPARIGSGERALGSVLGSFGQSRQFGAGLPGSVACPSPFNNLASGGGGGFGGLAAGGGGGFAAAATGGGGFASATTGGGGFGSAATGGTAGFCNIPTVGGGFVRAASGGFGSFNSQGGSGFSTFGGSGGTLRHLSELFTKTRK